MGYNLIVNKKEIKMSRYIATVPSEKAEAVFGVSINRSACRVSHGFDMPCTSYFCDLEPDCEIGVYYGGIGLTTQLSKWDYISALKSLGLTAAAEAVALDIPY